VDSIWLVEDPGQIGYTVRKAFTTEQLAIDYICEQLDVDVLASTDLVPAGRAFAVRHDEEPEFFLYEVQVNATL
jgi:hypothetical protein